MLIRRTEPFSFLFCAVGKIIIKNFIAHNVMQLPEGRDLENEISI